MSTQPSTFIDAAAKSLALAGAGLLVLSAAYDFSYLFAIGMSFEDVPTSLSDHIRSALVWAPRAAVYMLFVGMFDMGVRRLNHFFSVNQVFKRIWLPQFAAFRKVLRITFGVLLGVALLLDLLLTNSARSLYFGAMLCWGVLANWLVRQESRAINLSRIGRALFVAIPVVGLWIAFLGYSHGRATLEQPTPTWQVMIIRNGTSQMRQALGLRRFTASSVIIGADGRVEVVPNDSVAGATMAVPPASSSRSCAWLRVGCAPRAAPSPP